MKSTACDATVAAGSESRAEFWPTTLTNLIAAMFAVHGVATWITPTSNLWGVGVEPHDLSIGNYVRQVGAWQIVAALVFKTGLDGATSCAVVSSYASAISVLVCIPVNEYFDRSKPEAASGMVMLASLGMLISTGKLGPRVVGGLLSFLGLLIHFTPVETAVLYGIKQELTTPLLHSMISLMGLTIFISGCHVTALTYGITQSQALLITLLASVLLLFRWAIMLTP